MPVAINPRWPLLRRLVEAKLNASGVLANVKRGKFGSNPLGLTAENSLLLEFVGLGTPPRYRLLVSFLQADLRSASFLRHIGRCRDLLTLDLAVFCTSTTLSADETYALKNAGVHVLSVSRAGFHSGPFQPVPDFIHVPDLSYEELLEANFLGNDITKRLRKKFHLVLSELAAASYSSYGTFATKEVMRFEDDLLKTSLEEFLCGSRGALAIDVGCGDGRHSRVLARHFNEVIAFDISPRMLEAARGIDRNQLAEGAVPVTYYQCDVEYEDFPDEGGIKGKADFVCASFGMPSFVEDTAGFVRRVYAWLRPRGRAVFTLYNSRSSALAIDLPWKERALSAAIDLARYALEVELRDDVKFSIYCRACDDRVRDVIRGGFAIIREASFPHIMPLLPPSVFGTDERPRPDARRMFSAIERAIAWDTTFGRGHYAFLLLEKVDTGLEGFLRVQAQLETARAEYTLMDHEQVVSVAEVRRLLALAPGELVKTVILKRADTGEYFPILVGGTFRVDVSAVASILGCGPAALVLAPAQEVEAHFGFPIGGIAPFGYEGKARVLMDRRLANLGVQWVFMGSGDNRKTLKLAGPEFLRLTTSYEIADIATAHGVSS